MADRFARLRSCSVVHRRQSDPRSCFLRLDEQSGWAVATGSHADGIAWQMRQTSFKARQRASHRGRAIRWRLPGRAGASSTGGWETLLRRVRRSSDRP